MRRCRAALEDAVERASSSRKKSVALYELALFHDNNSREAVAIPLYENAVRGGLDRTLTARALAWLASSLYKTGKPRQALLRLKQSRAIASEAVLLKFLDGLDARINRGKPR